MAVWHWQLCAVQALLWAAAAARVADCAPKLGCRLPALSPQHNAASQGNTTGHTPSHTPVTGHSSTICSTLSWLVRLAPSPVCQQCMCCHSCEHCRAAPSVSPCCKNAARHTSHKQGSPATPVHRKEACRRGHWSAPCTPAPPQQHTRVDAAHTLWVLQCPDKRGQLPAPTALNCKPTVCLGTFAVDGAWQRCWDEKAHHDQLGQAMLRSAPPCPPSPVAGVHCAGHGCAHAPENMAAWQKPGAAASPHL
jgi:hypothetical protein